jgi:ribonucleoside-triphosphate reductase
MTKLSNRQLADSLYQEAVNAPADSIDTAEQNSHKIRLVIKRDDGKHHGEKEKYNIKKIKIAIESSYQAVGEPLPDNIWRRFNYYLKKFDDKVENEEIHVEDIQNIIEYFLMKENPDVAKAYIIYRHEHRLKRLQEKSAKLDEGLSEKLLAKNVVNQNANLDEESFGGRMGEAESFVVKRYALDNCMSPMAKQHHENGEDYIHDLNMYAVGAHNCLSIPFDNLLENGFSCRQADVRPAGSINTAMQLIAVIFQCQSLEQFGGVSATHLDWTMVPYVRMSFHRHFCDGLKYILDMPIVYQSFKSWDRARKQTTEMDAPDYTNRQYTKAWNYAMDMTQRELDQAVEGMYHNLNTLQSRSGNQLPFTSINYGTCTLMAGRMVIKALIQGCINGVGKFNKTAIFPCGIFQMKKGINRKKGDPNYDLYQFALQSTAKRIYPNYANCDWSAQVSWYEKDRSDKKKYLENLGPNEYQALMNRIEDEPEVGTLLGIKIEGGKLEVDMKERPVEIFSTMGCRTANGFDINFHKVFDYNVKKAINNAPIQEMEDYFSGANKDGRGNICPMTIILPTLAMEARIHNKITKGDLVEEFMHALDKNIEDAKDMLLERFEWIASQPASAAKYMWGNGTMKGFKVENTPRSALEHGTLAMGQIGLSETLYILIGEDQCSKKGMKLAKRIEQLMKDRCDEYKEKYQLNFGVYYTPAEGLCRTSMEIFKRKFGEFKNVTYYFNDKGERVEKEWMTNSIHVPVYKGMTPFDKIDIESQLTGYSSAGCITYIEVDSNVVNNIEALETYVNYAMDHDIPYFAINVKINTCNECGYSNPELTDTCPCCGSHDIEHLARVTGYLSTDVKNMNYGKQEEVWHRVLHVKYI